MNNIKKASDICCIGSFFCLAIDKNKEKDYKITIKFIIYFIFYL